MNPIVFALRRPVTVMMLVLALGWAGSSASPDAEGHLPVAQPAAALRHPQLRRDGSQADRGPDHQRLRAVLSVHQRRGACRVPVDPEHGDAQAVLPAGNRHGRGDGSDRRLLQPSPIGHAQWVAAAVCAPARRGQLTGRLSGLREPEPLGRRAPGPGAVPGPADVLGPGGHLVAARRSAATSGPSSSTSTPTGFAPTTSRPRTSSTRSTAATSSAPPAT